MPLIPETTRRRLVHRKRFCSSEKTKRTPYFAFLGRVEHSWTNNKVRPAGYCMPIFRFSLMAYVERSLAILLPLPMNVLLDAPFDYAYL
jgi:hypothetical protein